MSEEKGQHVEESILLTDLVDILYFNLIRSFGFIAHRHYLAFQPF